MTSEHTIQSDCIDLIRRRGGVVTRVNSGGCISKGNRHIALAKGGTSDLICCFNGHYLAIEVKDVGKTADDDQKDFGKQVNLAGGIFMVIDDVAKLSHELDILQRGEG